MQIQSKLQSNIHQLITVQSWGRGNCKIFSKYFIISVSSSINANPELGNRVYLRKGKTEREKFRCRSPEDIEDVELWRRAVKERFVNAEEREREDGEGEEAKMLIAGGDRRHRTMEKRDGG
ncbi:hypothetical protein LOK49_LG13G01108 [Camellia lanceoleosa]|uniref:Uncharacterized protein n=1 Tax=Camellia lanceoleosa TaxID=1840588 RepID=A0ACC0FEK6_9ERIC|nr:hypothetical protein LOK49_LG13G01108 [Camellia lanceoleosa]